MVFQVFSTIEYDLVNSPSKSFNESKIYCHGKIERAESSCKVSSKTSGVSNTYQIIFDKYHVNTACGVS